MTAQRTGNGPLVTALLLTYDSEKYAADAVRSVLGQDHRPLEVVVSDDASADGTVDVLEREIAAGRCDLEVRLLRQATNTGSKSAHLNRVVSSCTGDIVVSFDADDVSDARRVRELVRELERDDDVQAVYSRYSLMDESGRPLGPATVPHPRSRQQTSRWFARVDANASGATLAWRREVTDRFPPLAPDIAEDIQLPFRASLLGEVAFVDESLVTARRHAGSLTTDLERYRSLESYRARQELGIAYAHRNLDSRLADLAIARELDPERAEELDRLEVIAVDSVVKAQWTADLVHPSAMKRLATLARLTRSGAYREHFPRHALLALAPRFYLRYKRKALGVDGG